jgi:mRNA interferase RelE/StbE
VTLPYSIEYTHAAERAIRKLDRSLQQRLLKRIESLADKPRGAGTVKLTGHNSYRIRVGDYRIIYNTLDDRLLILIVEIGHRRDIYRNW